VPAVGPACGALSSVVPAAATTAAIAFAAIAFDGYPARASDDANSEHHGKEPASSPQVVDADSEPDHLGDYDSPDIEPRRGSSTLIAEFTLVS